jgi:hypothetical protein
MTCDRCGEPLGEGQQGAADEAGNMTSLCEGCIAIVEDRHEAAEQRNTHDRFIQQGNAAARMVHDMAEELRRRVGKQFPKGDSEIVW